jgi:hypothetical protein
MYQLANNLDWSLTAIALNMAERNGCISPPVTREAKTASDRFTYQENLCAKSLKMTNVVVVTKLVNVVRYKLINRHLFIDFFSDVEYDTSFAGS